MSKIDTTGWKEFKVGDLFSAVRGTSKIMREIEDGEVPIIAAARANQGVAKYGNIKSEYQNEITVSCNGVGCGSTFYHDGEFAISGDAMVLLPKYEISKETKIALAAVMDAKFSRKYSYEDKISPDKIKEETILLPTKEEYEPDWEYMENYMKAVIEETEEYIRIVGGFSNNPKYIDVSRWHKFRLGDYFDFETGKDMLPAKEKAGDIPVVCLGSNNNGIGLYITENPKHKLYNEGCITIAGWAGGLFAFYQEQKFYVKGRVKIAIPKQPLSKLAGLFMCTMIDSESWKYTYAEKASGDKLPNTELYLPATSTGEPDWQYMEDYVKNIMEESENIIESLYNL